MKIRKIAEYTEKGTQEKFEIVWAKEEEGWELSEDEMRGLRDLINRAVEPALFIPPWEHHPFSQELQKTLKNTGMTINGLDIKETFIDEYDKIANTVFPEPIFEPDPPVISKSMGADLVPEVVCENGACTLVIPEAEEEIEISEEKKPEPVKKEKKRRKIERDYSKYIEMKASGHPIKDIKRAMADDLGVSIQSAENYYYANVRNAVAPERGQDVIEKEKKELLKAIEPKVKSKKKVDQEIFDSINDMIHYHTPQQFKDACVAADIGRGKYSVNDLKEMYLETHPEVRW